MKNKTGVRDARAERGNTAAQWVDLQCHIRQGSGSTQRTNEMRDRLRLVGASVDADWASQ